MFEYGGCNPMKKMTSRDPETHSPDFVAENLAVLRELFPELITEGADGAVVNLDVLKQLVGDKTVTDAEEKYGLNWHGKRLARQIALAPSTGTLRPCPEESVDWETTRNLMIEGDNLEVLKLLQKSYSGKVKMIYIDPPYNTGKDFVYPDDFQDGIKNYLSLTGQNGPDGRMLSSNTEASGRFHTNWLNMMYPRLKLARSLLAKDGAVFISIDDRELNHLRLLGNEIFGEENHVATITVVNNLKGRNDKKHVAMCHEYVVIYSGQEFTSYGLPLTEEQREAFRHVDDKGLLYALRDLRKRGGPDRREDRPNMYFAIYWNEEAGRCSLERMTPEDIEIFPMRGDGTEGCWRWGREKVAHHLDWLHPKHTGRNGRWDVEHRLYLDTSITVYDDPEEDEDESDDEENGIFERTSKPKSIWIGGEFSTDSGKRSLKSLMPGETFNFPKSVEFLRTCIQLTTRENDIVLDLFAGSGTTGQAVVRQNESDGFARRYILVQIPEHLSPSERSQQTAISFCDALGIKRNLAELTKERIRRAGAKLKEENPLFFGDVGFKVFKLDTSNIRAWEPDRDDLAESLGASIDHIKFDRGDRDILFELLLKLGFDLCVPVQTKSIAGAEGRTHEIVSVGGGALIVCLSRLIGQDDAEPLALSVVEWRKELQPSGETTALFLDSAFENDVAKCNVTAILEQFGIENVRSL